MMPSIPRRTRSPRRATPAALAVLLSALATGASADRDEHARHTPLLPRYAQECGACHTAYAPGLLPAPAWARVMGRLDRHYGADATLDPAEAQVIAAWLAREAGPDAGTGAGAADLAADDRITTRRWFVREHRPVDAATWRLPSVGSPSNCAACHLGADQGRYSEHALRWPEGLSASQRRAWAD